jgi:hypothetical protein
METEAEAEREREEGREVLVGVLGDLWRNCREKGK